MHYPATLISKQVYCEKHKTPQKQVNSCENFTDNTLKQQRHEWLLLNNLNHSLKSLNHIAQILKEKYSN